MAKRIRQRPRPLSDSVPLADESDAGRHPIRCRPGTPPAPPHLPSA
ncbi:hypothetical protein I551_3706 [Mycobacterium ulcerans str. Harvey]|uniref:Uncharacterized protein n=1 Tax=Mycobacterium ulcerans str. Harvey TaxID=1299332 RepID=A0ABN0QYV1_MYCUL|nr:hypothetical protein I551_3706 [Mycobacterium ulcerans str. Harvey]